MKKSITYLFIMLILTGCGGFPSSSKLGDVYLPLLIERRNITVCKNVVDPEHYLDEYHCIELFTDKEFIVSKEEWEEEVGAGFALYNHSEILSWANDRIQLCKEFPKICGDQPYQTLGELKDFAIDRR